MNKEVYENLNKIDKLFKTKESWVKKAYVLDKNSKPISLDSPNAAKWCLVGGIYAVCFKNDNPLQLRNTLYNLFSILVKEKGYNCITAFNDDEKTIFTTVKKVIKEAKRRVKSGEVV